MKLAELFQNIISAENVPDIEVKGISLDSRKIQPGELFIAIPGTKLNGAGFLKEAIKKGAIAILQSSNEKVILTETLIPTFLCSKNIRETTAKLAAKFYNFPSRNFSVIGITGTNGKTSISNLIASVFHDIGKNTAIIGTIGYGVFPDKLNSLDNTTPDAIDLQKIFFEFTQKKVDLVAMEVSSHALDQNRVAEINFDVGIFTNLTHDHLVYHKTMENYAEAKKKLFLANKLKLAVINLDDSVGKKWFDEFTQKHATIGFSLNKKNIGKNSVVAEQIQLTAKGISAFVHTPWGSGQIFSKLIGKFNVENLLATIAVLGFYGISFAKITEVIAKVKPVSGRMQTFFGKNGKPLVVVDYSHTPDALEQALKSLREHCLGKLICVFGCGGDKDRAKRSMMGAIAEKHSDSSVITNDNPRTEDPGKIINEIIQGISGNNFKVEYDREKAIKYAIKNAGENDIVLIAGKGHEDYQIIGTKKYHLSDVEIVENFKE